MHVEQELAHDREREVAFRQLDELAVAVVHRLAEIRERILVASLAFDLAREPQEHRRLADQVERDVRERDVLLEDRTVTAPFGQPVAEHQAVVAEPQQILEQRVRRLAPAARSDGRRRHTPSHAARNLVELRMTIGLVVARIEERPRVTRGSTP